MVLAQCPQPMRSRTMTDGIPIITQRFPKGPLEINASGCIRGIQFQKPSLRRQHRFLWRPDGETTEPCMKFQFLRACFNSEAGQLPCVNVTETAGRDIGFAMGEIIRMGTIVNQYTRKQESPAPYNQPTYRNRRPA